MDFKKLLESFDAVEKQTSVKAKAIQKATGSIGAILESFNRLENDEIVEAEKPDFLDIDGDGDTKESMKKAAKDKKDKVVKEGFDGEVSDRAWEHIQARKEELVDMGMEPEEAQDQAAEEIGVDPEELEDWLANKGASGGGYETWDGKTVYPKIGDTIELYYSEYEDGPEEEWKPNATGKIVGDNGDGTFTLKWRDHESGEILTDDFSVFDEFAILNKDAHDPNRISESRKTNKVEEAIMVSAEGSEAEALLQILKLSGMPAPVAPALPEPQQGPMEPAIDMQDEYANSPDEFDQDLDSVIASGNDLHREKSQYPAAARGDNPMRAFEGKFKAILDELLAEDEINEAAPDYSATYIKTLKNNYGDKKSLSKSDMSKAKNIINKSSNANIKQLAAAGIPHVSAMAKEYVKNKIPGGMKKEQ